MALVGNGTYNSDFTPPDPPFSKAIIMVVDAMRSDFMFSERSSMHFVHSLIRKGDALGLTAYASPPTVTLPRLKGITTGSTPNFLDAILNIAEEDTSSSLGDYDSIIKQFFTHRNMTINMFGDDTWIKLFPTFFHKTDGTSSFYVSDYTEVDQNVTRHLHHELHDSENWDLMIMHYLGLDHIGHKAGPNSILMPEKQREMDDVIRSIYNEHLLQHPETLLVVLGDHGMNEVGNHGGSSPGETSPGLVFVSQKLSTLPGARKKAPLPYKDDFDFYQKINQIDLVPTLAGLLGVPIPKNNLGVLIECLLPLFSKKDQKTLLVENALQLRHLLNVSGYDIDWEDDARSFALSAQRILSKSSSNYNYPDIIFGFVVFALTSVYFLFMCVTVFQKNTCIISLSIPILYGICFFASSYVEEEHHVWWWLTTVSFVAFSKYNPAAFSHKKSHFFLLLIILRILKAWNNSGQKFNFPENVKVSKWLNEHTSVLWVLVSLTYMCFVELRGGISKFMPTFIPAAMSFTIKVLRASEDGVDIPEALKPLLSWTQAIVPTHDTKACLHTLYQSFYYSLTVGILVLLFIRVVLSNRMVFTSMRTMLNIFILNQTAINNVPLFLIFYTMEQLLKQMISRYAQSNDPAKVSLVVAHTQIALQSLSFFSLGMTNSLATIDLTNSFNGVSSYMLLPVGLLTFLANWSGPVFWSFFFHELCLKNNRVVFYKQRLALAAVYSIAGVCLMSSCIVLRFHLFIWTVFSPKLLYYLSWLLLSNFMVDLGLGTLFLGF